MAETLENKVVVVTGGASGIGYEIAKNYLEKGAKTIIILDINEKAGDLAVKTLNENYGSEKAVFIKCDVTKDLEIFDEIIEKYKQIDAFVDNAGIFDETNVKKTVGTNVTAVIEWGLKFWEHMRTDNGGQGGTILTISSIFGYLLYEYAPVYNATKHAILTFSKALGHETNFKKSGVRVISLCPGATTTNMHGIVWCYQEDRNKYVAEHFKHQPVDVVGKAAVEVFEKAKSGTVWSIAASQPIAQV